MNILRHTGLAVVVAVLGNGLVRPATAQWGISLEAQRSAYGGASKDTSAGPQGSFRPSRTRALTVRVERGWKRFTATLGARVARSDIALDANDISATLYDQFTFVEFLPEVSCRIVRTSHGATLNLYGGPVIGVWTFQDLGRREVSGATAGLHSSFPIFDRLALSLRVGGSLMRSVFRPGELPSELVIRSMRRSEISLGLRYGR